MKKLIIFALASLLAGFMAMACQRDHGVYAGNDSETYKPRAAPSTTATPGSPQDVKGELLRVDMAGKTVAVRVENGMEQTFKFDDNTVLTGLDQPQARKDKTPLRNLAGKEGSELSVRWRDENGAKMASNIQVTQVSTSKNTRRSKRH